jgi:hypothetical protein
MHVPANAATQIPRDNIIPEWADSEYPFDTIPRKLLEAIPHAFFDLNRKVKQRGRVHVVVLHDNIYLSADGAEDNEKV